MNERTRGKALGEDRVEDGGDMEADPESEELRIARAFLSAVVEAPAPATVQFVHEHGPCRAAELVREGDVPPPVGEEVQARRRQASGERSLEAADSVGARLVVPEGKYWPHGRFSSFSAASEVGLTSMAEPLALWAKGSASPAEVLASSVAIVGARAASGYGEHVAAELAHGLGTAGFTTVSGAAYGIDGAAHRGALAAATPTAAFLACGVEIDYPAGNSRLLRSIAEQGVVISEYVPGTLPRKHRFLVRNRLIAASGQGTVVVEAGARSGASNTANTAELLGRPVMSVPGQVTSMNSVGCHELVRSGKAMLVTKAEEIVEMVSPMGSAPKVDVVSSARETDNLDGSAKRIHDALTEREGVSAEQLAQDSGLPLRKVRAVLPALEMAGLAALGECGWSRRRGS